VTIIIDPPQASSRESAPASRPYWLRDPCPPWCDTKHADGDCWEDRLHSAGDHDVNLTLEPRIAVDSETFTAHIGTGLWMHYRDVRPHVCLSVNDRAEILLELDEAEEAARLLAAPPAKWEAVTLTMMEPDDVTPPGYGSTARSAQPGHVSPAAFPFTRPPLLAVRRVLDTVMVFCPVLPGGVGSGRGQESRYLALTPGEATELAAAVTDLVRQGMPAIEGALNLCPLAGISLSGRKLRDKTTPPRQSAGGASPCARG
jgi:hypothetical protein